MNLPQHGGIKKRNPRFRGFRLAYETIAPLLIDAILYVQMNKQMYKHIY
jgi:hypothetical protein